MEQPQLNPLHDCTGPLTKAAVVQMVAEKQADWDDFLDPVLFLLRTTVNPTTRFSPYSLMFNRKANFPNEVKAAHTFVNLLVSGFHGFFFGFFSQTTLNLLNDEEQADAFSTKEQASTCMSIIEEQQDSVKQLVIRLYSPT